MKEKNMTIKIASRPSNLAIRQVHEVMKCIDGISWEFRLIESLGDKNQSISLITNTISDIFTREIDQSILDGNADIAVHSAKDLPYPIPEGLEVIALLEAFDKSDALVSKNSLKLNELPKGAKIGTSSPVRMKQLKCLRYDIETVSIRGTIEERIKQVDDGSIDAVIVATCALIRLGLDKRISEILPFETHPLQGNLAIVAKSENKELAGIFEKKDIRKRFGKVFLVGAGPGKIEWLTLKAIELIKAADCLVYDDLIDKNILQLSNNEQIYVGKRPGNHVFDQDEINELIYNKALSGKTVVRLKGGDPMLFGHAGEEIFYLESRLIDVEVVPGITAALGAAALSHTPLTMRSLSNSVAFCTGHSKETLPLPSTETVVYYMGASNLKHIAKKLIESGWETATPTKLVSKIGSEEQQIETLTLDEIIQSEKIFTSPLISIIGNVTDKSNWYKAFETRKKILFTGTHPEKYYHLGQVLHQPLIEIRPVPDLTHFEKVTENIEKFNWILFTSSYSVSIFFDNFWKLGKDSRRLASCKIASIGNFTSDALKKCGILPDIQAVDESSEGLVAAFYDAKIHDQKILLPRSSRGLPILPEGLSELNNEVTILHLYTSEIPANTERMDLSGFDQIIFTSPSSVENFVYLYGYLPDNIELISKGNETRKAIEKYSLTYQFTNK